MDRPWTPENTVSPALAADLIREQFPDLAAERVEPLGAGWDNTAYRIDDTWVFRFPRRELARELILRECAILPTIAPKLPLPVPVPSRVGEPSPRYPWPFAGYRHLSGTNAAIAGLDAHERRAAAAALGRFLAALHALSADTGLRAGLGHDDIGRLDLEKRRGQIEQRLQRARERGLIDDLAPYREIAADVPAAWSARQDVLVHGDFHASQLLVDDARALCGVIDWGDVHLGDPAGDISIAHGFLPPEAHGDFRDAYGPIDADSWRVARLRALHLASTILVYAHDQHDRALLREALLALAHVDARST